MPRTNYARPWAALPLTVMARHSQSYSTGKRSITMEHTRGVFNSAAQVWIANFLGLVLPGAFADAEELIDGFGDFLGHDYNGAVWNPHFHG